MGRSRIIYAPGAWVALLATVLKNWSIGTALCATRYEFSKDRNGFLRSASVPVPLASLESAVTPLISSCSSGGRKTKQISIRGIVYIPGSLTSMSFPHVEGGTETPIYAIWDTWDADGGMVP